VIGREHDALAWLEGRREELTGFAGDLIRTPSPNPPGDERAVADLLADRLDAFGLPVDRLAREPTRANLVARLNAGAGRRLVLNGHTDTKPPGDVTLWETDPFVPEVIDGELRGLGAVDMKGQVAAMVYAAGALAATSALGAGELIVALTADEEAGSRLGAHFLADTGALQADAVVVGEASGVTEQWESLPVLTRGFSGFRVRVEGTWLHSSLLGRVPAVNASVKMAEVLSRFHREFRPTFDPHALCPEGPGVNAGAFVSAGAGYGVCAGEAEFAVDVRTVPGMTHERLRADLDRFLDKLRGDDPELRVQARFEDGPLAWNEGTTIAGDAPVVKAALDAAEVVLGRRLPLGSWPAGTDASIFQRRAGIPAIPALGPGLLSLAHQPNERIPVEGIVDAAKLYAVLACRFLDGAA
jgi:acetylornithine deacetylase/succinyl-diaminopimelate desuccinylase-like protein